VPPTVPAMTEREGGPVFLKREGEGRNAGSQLPRDCHRKVHVKGGSTQSVLCLFVQEICKGSEENDKIQRKGT